MIRTNSRTTSTPMQTPGGPETPDLASQIPLLAPKENHIHRTHRRGPEDHPPKKTLLK